jgi:hypothetical protein
MEAVVEQAGTDVSAIMSGVFVRMDRVVNRIFGCWHRDMSLPFSRDKENYRTCVACGARRRFDLERWTTVGPLLLSGRQFALVDRVPINNSYAGNVKNRSFEFW